jgi:hypothetical protein
VLKGTFMIQFLRLLNLALTTTTLGIAVAGRNIERRHHVEGVVGSSMCVIISQRCIWLIEVAVPST